MERSWRERGDGWRRERSEENEMVGVGVQKKDEDDPSEMAEHYPQ